MNSAPRTVAVVGAGWAGLACAVEAVGHGHRVTLYEASRMPGGRARTVPLVLPDGSPFVADNGQHILIGAYAQTLRLMRRVGVDPAAVLEALPLTLRFADGDGIALPRWPAPLDVLAGIVRARGWTWHERLSLLRVAAGWAAHGFRAEPGQTVTQLCGGLAPRAYRDLIEPLCVSALNTPASQASAQVFLRVLHDALLAKGDGDWGSSWLLLPRVPLGALFAQPALRWLESRDADVKMGHRVERLEARLGADAGWNIDGQPFDRVVLACPSTDAARLVEGAAIDSRAWVEQARALRFEVITTVYAAGSRGLDQPLLALRASETAPAQFVFDRGRLGGPPGVLAFVVSASRGEREAIELQVLQQAAAAGFGPLQAIQTVAEKRATFACTPGLARPAQRIAPSLLACGDYIEGPYPATIEGAARSGIAAAATLRA